MIWYYKHVSMDLSSAWHKLKPATVMLDLEDVLANCVKPVLYPFLKVLLHNNGIVVEVCDCIDFSPFLLEIIVTSAWIVLSGFRGIIAVMPKLFSTHSAMKLDMLMMGPILLIASFRSLLWSDTTSMCAWIWPLLGADSNLHQWCLILKMFFPTVSSQCFTCLWKYSWTTMV